MNGTPAQFRRIGESEASARCGIAHLLIVGDNAALRRMCAAMLTRAGFVTSEARDLEHARSNLTTTPFDCIIVDETAGAFPERRFLRRLRLTTGRRPMLAICRTPPPEGDITEAWSDFDAFVTVPFTYYELLMRVETALHPRSRDPFELEYTSVQAGSP